MSDEAFDVYDAYVSEDSCACLVAMVSAYTTSYLLSGHHFVKGQAFRGEEAKTKRAVTEMSNALGKTEETYYGMADTPSDEAISSLIYLGSHSLDDRYVMGYAVTMRSDACKAVVWILEPYKAGLTWKPIVTLKIFCGGLETSMFFRFMTANHMPMLDNRMRAFSALYDEHTENAALHANYADWLYERSGNTISRSRAHQCRRSGNHQIIARVTDCI